MTAHPQIKFKDIKHRLRKIVEHPFGKIKRQSRFNYIIIKQGMQRASSDFGFTMVAYNLRRLVNSIGLNYLKQYLESIVHLFCINIARLKPFSSCFVIFKKLLKEETENALLILNFEKQNYISTTLRGF